MTTTQLPSWGLWAMGAGLIVFIVLLVLFVFALCSEFKQAEQEGERMAAEFTARRNHHAH